MNKWILASDKVEDCMVKGWGYRPYPNKWILDSNLVIDLVLTPTAAYQGRTTKD